MNSNPKYDAFLLLSFGGPESADDVLPFLENVLRGKNVPRARMLEVAQHYQQLGGISPINDQNRKLIEALRQEFDTHQVDLPIYWGNRNWHPLLADTLRQMAKDGIQQALALVTSAYSSYSGCRQYLEDIDQAQQEVGQTAPKIDKIRAFFNHPGFIEPMIESVSACWEKIAPERREQTLLLFTAHSIPQEMADRCEYELQLQESCRLVAGKHRRWELVYQSRSGAPHHPWLEPDVCQRIEQLHQQEGLEELVLLPIGFVADHLEVLFDIDTEARTLCERLGIGLHRASTVGTHPRFIKLIYELVKERTSNSTERTTLGTLPPCPDVCPDGCCPRR